jgi:hypothetical protein
MSERELAIEKYLITTIEVLGGLCLKFAVPGIRGYMDRLCILPGGVIFFVEVKRPKGGVLAELQKVRREEMQRLGCRCYVVKDRGEIDYVIAENQGYTRRSNLRRAG